MSNPKISLKKRKIINVKNLANDELSSTYISKTNLDSADDRLYDFINETNYYFMFFYNKTSSWSQMLKALDVRSNVNFTAKRNTEMELEWNKIVSIPSLNTYMLSPLALNIEEYFSLKYIYEFYKESDLNPYLNESLAFLIIQSLEIYKNVLYKIIIEGKKREDELIKKLEKLSLIENELKTDILNLKAEITRLTKADKDKIDELMRKITDLSQKKNTNEKAMNTDKKQFKSTEVNTDNPERMDEERIVFAKKKKFVDSASQINYYNEDKKKKDDDEGVAVAIEISNLTEDIKVSEDIILSLKKDLELSKLENENLLNAMEIFKKKEIDDDKSTEMILIDYFHKIKTDDFWKAYFDYLFYDSANMVLESSGLDYVTIFNENITRADYKNGVDFLMKPISLDDITNYIEARKYFIIYLYGASFYKTQLKSLTVDLKKFFSNEDVTEPILSDISNVITTILNLSIKADEKKVADIKIELKESYSREIQALKIISDNKVKKEITEAKNLLDNDLLRYISVSDDNEKKITQLKQLYEENENKIKNESEHIKEECKKLKTLKVTNENTILELITTNSGLSKINEELRKLEDERNKIQYQFDLSLIARREYMIIIEDKKKENEYLTTELDIIRLGKDELNNKYRQAENFLDEERKKVSALDERIKAQENSIDKYFKQLNTTKLEKEKAGLEVINQSNELKILIIEKKKLQETIDTTSRELKNMHNQSKFDGSIRDSLRKDLDTLKKKYVAEIAEITKAKINTEDVWNILKRDLKFLSEGGEISQVSSKDEDVLRIKGMLEKYQSDLVAYKGQKEKIEEENKEIIKSLEKSKEQSDLLKGVIEQKKGDKIYFEDEIARLNRELDRALTENNEFQLTIQTLNNDIIELAHGKETLQSQLNFQINEVTNKLNTELSEKNFDIQTRKDEIDNYIAQNNQKITELETHKTALYASNEEQRVYIEELKVSNDEKLGSYTELIAKITHLLPPQIVERLNSEYGDSTDRKQINIEVINELVKAINRNSTEQVIQAVAEVQAKIEEIDSENQELITKLAKENEELTMRLPLLKANLDEMSHALDVSANLLATIDNATNSNVVNVLNGLNDSFVSELSMIQEDTNPSYKFNSVSDFKDTLKEVLIRMIASEKNLDHSQVADQVYAVTKVKIFNSLNLSHVNHSFSMHHSGYGDSLNESVIQSLNESNVTSNNISGIDNSNLNLSSMAAKELFSSMNKQREAGLNLSAIITELNVSTNASFASMAEVDQIKVEPAMIKLVAETAVAIYNKERAIKQVSFIDAKTTTNENIKNMVDSSFAPDFLNKTIGQKGSSEQITLSAFTPFIKKASLQENRAAALIGETKSELQAKSSQILDLYTKQQLVQVLVNNYNGQLVNKKNQLMTRLSFMSGKSSQSDSLNSSGISIGMNSAVRLETMGVTAF